MTFAALMAALTLAGSPMAQDASSASAPTAATAAMREAGFVAEYYAAVGTSAGSVVVLGGSEGGLGGRAVARRLAAEGFDVLTVAYFGEPELPAKLDRVPIEPVTRAVDWLQARSADPVAIVGVSKGAELALIVASRDPRIRAVVAAVPTSVVWQGIDMAGGPTGGSWTAEGQVLPYVEYDLSRGFNGIYRLYADSLPGAAEEDRIPVERINGPLMLVSSAQDRLWPSQPMSEEIEARLRAHGFVHAVSHLTYPEAGHGVFGRPLTRAATPQMLEFVGGTPEGLAAAREDVWPKAVAFLKTALAD